MIYIFDIDGTIADLTHRKKFIDKEPRDWIGFYAACPGDRPIVEVIEVLAALQHMGAKIVLVSGRSSECKKQTEEWLATHRVRYNKLVMRRRGDHREDAIVKDEMLTTIECDIGKVTGVFEDRQQCVDMYRKRGLRVFQVAEGNF